MHIVYDQGPPRIDMGAAGAFRRGELHEVNDAVARALLKKRAPVTFRAVELVATETTATTRKGK